MASKRQGNRRQQILEALARELEVHPEARITTARLAEVVGVSEAALYRHFPSKAKMFEALIEFAEESVFGLANRILAEESDPLSRCEKLLSLVLGFAKRNPGITRILCGDALVGENQRLQDRAAQFFQRLETQIKQVLREGEVGYGRSTGVPVTTTAGLLMAVAEGRIAQFNRSGFRRSPLEGWESQWALLAPVLFPQ